jgi:regulator of sigma E protease
VSTFVYVIEIVIALGLIIFVHELGHFLAAKGFGVWVRRFAIGFGPAIWTRRRGGPLPQHGMPPAGDPNRYETEYSLRVLPLGGFVEPMGDHPEAEGGDDPRALWRRPAWQKIVVFSAGVGMNAVLAVLFFTVASLVGIQSPSPIIGRVTPLLAADTAGIRAGDRVVAINDQPVTSFDDIILIIASRNAGSAFTVTVERPKDGATERLTFSNLVSVKEQGDLAPRLGLEPSFEPVIYNMIPGGPDQQAGLEPGDRFLTVAGKPIQRWQQVGEYLAEAPSGPVALTVKRQGKPLDLVIEPAKLKVYDPGLDPILAVGSVAPDSPAAKAGVHRDDRILKINDKAWPGIKEASDAIKAVGDGGKVHLVLERRGEEVELTAIAAIYGNSDVPRNREPRIGIAMEEAPARVVRLGLLGRLLRLLGFVHGAAESPLRVGRVEPDSPAAKAGIQPGDAILTIGEKEIRPGSLEDVYALAYMLEGKTFPIRLRRGGSELTVMMAPDAKSPERFAFLWSQPGGYLYEPLPRLYNPLKAMDRGFHRTWLWLGRVYANLVQLMKGQVSTESVGGPVLIVQSSLGIASRGLGTFLDFWGILSVCIAVFNFLPVPPFDGGHVLFVLIEKLKGSPVGIKVRTWIWGAGWAAVVVLFILVTWQDIARLL